MADSRHIQNPFLAIIQQRIGRFQWKFAQRSRIALRWRSCDANWKFQTVNVAHSCHLGSH